MFIFDSIEYLKNTDFQSVLLLALFYKIRTTQDIFLCNLCFVFFLNTFKSIFSCYRKQFPNAPAGQYSILLSVLFQPSLIFFSTPPPPSNNFYFFLALRCAVSSVFFLNEIHTQSLPVSPAHSPSFRAAISKSTWPAVPPEI